MPERPETGRAASAAESLNASLSGSRAEVGTDAEMDSNWDRAAEAETLVRSRRYLFAHASKAGWASALGIFESLLAIAVLGLAALAMTIADSSHHAAEGQGAAEWIAANRASSWLPHRWGADGLELIRARLPLLQTDLGAIALISALALALALIAGLTRAVRRGRTARSTAEATAALRNQIHRQFYRLGRSSLPTEGIEAILEMFSRDVDAIRAHWAAVLNKSPRLPILIIGLTILAFLISPELTVFLTALLALGWLFRDSIERRVRRLTEEANHEANFQLSLLKEDLSLLRTVRVYSIEDYDRERFEKHLDDLRAADVERLRQDGKEASATVFVATAGLGLAAILTLGMVAFAHRLSMAGAVSVVGLLGVAACAMMIWRGDHARAKRAAQSCRNVFDYLGLKSELRQEAGAQFLRSVERSVRFDEITLKGELGSVLLDRVSLEIPARKKTSIIGLNDETKYALVSLIPRLIDPTLGRILIDGQNLRDLTMDSVRAQVALVLQDDLTFSDSVAANIGLGLQFHSWHKVIEAAKAAHAHQFIRRLPQGYDTIIGPLGETLSVDERFRIALARAYLHDASVVVIEEPRARLDEDARRLIDDAVRRLAKNRTLIFLAHRQSTIRGSDKVVVLHEGRVEIEGPPKDVRAKSKLMRHIEYVEFNQFAYGDIEAGQMAG